MSSALDLVIPHSLNGVWDALERIMNGSDEVINLSKSLSPDGIKELDKTFLSIQVNGFLEALTDNTLPLKHRILNSHEYNFFNQKRQTSLKAQVFGDYAQKQIQFASPILFGEEETTFIAYINQQKFLDKKTLKQIAEKIIVESGTTNKQHTDWIAHIGLASPFLYFIANDSYYKSNPTIKLLNKALKKLGVNDLENKEHRTAYLAARELNEGVYNALSKYGLKYDQPNLYLNALQSAATKWVNANQEEATDEQKNLLLIIGYCIALLSGSIVASALIVTSLNSEVGARIGEMVMAPAPREYVFCRLLAEQPTTTTAFEIFQAIAPYKEHLLGYRAIEEAEIRYIDSYFIRYFEAKSVIIEKLVETTGNESETVNAFRAEDLNATIQNILNITVGKYSDLMAFLEDVSKEMTQRNERTNLVDSLSAELKKMCDIVEASDTLQIDSKHEVTDESLAMAKACEQGIITFDEFITAMSIVKHELYAAQKNEDYEAVIDLATKLKAADNVFVFNQAQGDIIAFLKTFNNASISDDNTLSLSLPQPKQKNTQRNQATELKTAKKKNYELEKLVAELTEKTKELQNELKKAKTETAIPQISSTVTQAEFDRACDIERRFMFGEKVSLLEAVQLFQTKFPHVKLGDNVLQQARDSSYNSPQKLYKYLYLLANDYFKAITNGQPDSIAKDILGQAYRANESPTVLSNPKWMNQRKFLIDGTKRLILKHINVSQSRAQTSCSIYFDIDNAGGTPTLTIAYIGPHLDNTLS